MNDAVFRIDTPGMDVERIVSEIRASVAEKMEKGLYTDIRVARAERANLANLRNEENFLSFYLDCLRDAVYVDISDFEIFERRRRFSRLLIGLKRFIWKLLKFYTYRLWSQQNQINGLLLSAVEGMEERYGDTIKDLQSRIEKLESELRIRNGNQ
jgi:hypothetical protein